MELKELFARIADIKTSFGLAAFAIAAVLAAVNIARSRSGSRPSGALWGVIAAICVLALVPIVLDMTSQTLKRPTVYRVRVTTVDERNVPAGEATVKATAVNEGKTAQDGSCELLIPEQTLPESRTVTIYADKDDLHGSLVLSLHSDANPSVTIHLASDRTAGLRGIVEDEARHALAGVRISVSGANMVVTELDGTFVIPPFTAPSRRVRLHAEKPGFRPMDQYHAAGDTPATILLERDRR
jgi:hypothetical protein